MLRMLSTLRVISGHPLMLRTLSKLPERLRGATWDKRAQKWKAIITVNGIRNILGSFDDAKQASDAYMAAKIVMKDQQYRANRERGASRLTAPGIPTSETGMEKHPTYIGVIREPGVALWEAVICVDGKDISGGEYDSAEEAAKAFDALARMYLGAEVLTNFPISTYAEWVPPEAVVTTGQIETRIGQPLNVNEIEAALRTERGENIRVVPLAGKSDLAEFMIFVSGKSVIHMRKMADMVSRALRKRHLPGVDPTVEAREMDDWMVVDCGNIIVNVMDPEAREVFDLETFYENMEKGVDPYAGLTYDEWLAKNPIHPKWMARLQRDEDELDAQQRLR